MMTRTIAILMSLIIFPFLIYSQIINGNFNEWEYNGGYYIPVGWECEGVTPEVISCKQIQVEMNDYGVRIANILPCGLAESQNDFRSPGNFSSNFITPYEAFMFSYHIVIDSIDQPAYFRVWLSKQDQQGMTILYDESHSEIKNEVVEVGISGVNINDEIGVFFQARGEPGDSTSSSCNIGYISAILDNVSVSEVVRLNNLKESMITVYPNPFSSTVRLDFEGGGAEEVIVYDSLGNKIFGSKCIGANYIDLYLKEQLKAGVYYFEVRTATNRLISKVIKVP